MKNNILLVVTALAFQSSLCITNAQEFKPTEKYALINERIIGQEEGAGRIDLVISENRHKTIAILDITQLELLEEVHLTVLPDPNLEDITEILKVEVEYAASCIRTDTYYFLVTVDNDFIGLPHIENLYCGPSRFDTHFIFPNQAYGQEGAILKAELQYTEKNTIKDIRPLQSFVWNDDDFDYQDTSTAINY